MKARTPEQLKGQIRNFARKRNLQSQEVLQMFLLERVLDRLLEVTKQAVSEYKVMETDDFFEMLHRSLLAKCSLMEKYPYISAFSLNAYYEQYPEIKSAIEDNFLQESQTSENLVLSKINTAKLRKDIDEKAMYEEIFYAMDGYMLKNIAPVELIPKRLKRRLLC